MLVCYIRSNCGPRGAPGYSCNDLYVSGQGLPSGQRLSLKLSLHVFTYHSAGLLPMLVRGRGFPRESSLLHAYMRIYIARAMTSLI